MSANHAAPSCTGTPVSWLRLEQHHDRTLAASEHAAIDAHLAECPACAACFAEIQADASTALPPLVLPQATRAAPARPDAKVIALRRIAPVIAALAVAALLFFVLRRPGSGLGGTSTGGPAFDPTSARTKGGGVDFVLVRDDEHEIAEAGGVYRDGDRWKVLVTCPTSMGARDARHAAWDLVVLERGEAFFPLEPAPDLECGNAVPLPGAFRTTGHAPMVVCLVWNEGALVDRPALHGASPETLPHASCKELTPAD